MPTFSKLVEERERRRRRKMCTNKILGSLEFLAINKIEFLGLGWISLTFFTQTADNDDNNSDDDDNNDNYNNKNDH